MYVARWFINYMWFIPNSDVKKNRYNVFLIHVGVIVLSC